MLGDFLSLYNDVKDPTTRSPRTRCRTTANVPTVTESRLRKRTLTVAVVTPAIAGVTVTYSLIGTDGYFLSGTRTTDASGAISFGVASTCGGVRTR